MSDPRSQTLFLDSIIEYLPAMIFVKDARDLRFERFNRAGEELLGLSREQLIGRTDYDFFPKEQADFFVAKDREVLRRKTLEDIPEEPIATPRGTRWLHTRKIPILGQDGEPTHLLGVSIDITERKEAEALLRASHADLERKVIERTVELRRTEEQLRHSQKMEAIGRLAGGIAHDFNNLLTVILGYSSLLLKRLPKEDALRGSVEEVHRAGGRAAELTHQLLAFSRQQVLTFRVIDPGDVVRGIERILKRILGEDIEIRIRHGASAARVKADAVQLEQVLMNLVVNARDAMPRGGRLTIETAVRQVGQPEAGTRLGIRPGTYATLAVSDTGVGMDKAVLGRIFEPFFTTKEKGKGTGLGLSTAFGIVRQSDGAIAVASEPGKGSTFTIYLPVTEEAEEKAPASLAVAGEARGTETILLVEDEDQVRAMTGNILAERGYRVISTARASAAMAEAQSFEGPIHLLLTDVIMPETGGRLLAQELLSIRPDMRVLFMSGYTDDAMVRYGVLESGLAFLQKPFTPEDLARRVRETLDTPAGEGKGGGS
ncbi:MAG: PAS domain-containing protein [Planctomycetes bacterium]|nr:PAS domain-containing protein [Planctomycetota bacterium]